MDKIIELLKSVKFWGIISGVAATISALPIIVNWLSITPEPTIYVGSLNNDNMLRDDETVVLNYILTGKQDVEKCIVPLPLVFCNENNATLDKFYVELQTKAKEVDDRGYMKRLLSYSYHFGDRKKEVSRLFHDEASFDNQIVGNKGNRVEFNPNDREENIWLLNLAGKGGFSESVWDTFDIDVETGSNGHLRKFTIRINCFYNDDIENVKRMVTENKREGEKNFILIPHLYKFALTPDSIKVSVYDLEKSNVYFN